MPRNPEYLGDAVYVAEDEYVPGAIRLTTGHHDPIHASNTIILEPEVVEALLRWLNQKQQ